jgi:hypothetical protein
MKTMRLLLMTLVVLVLAGGPTVVDAIKDRFVVARLITDKKGRVISDSACCCESVFDRRYLSF